MRFALRSNRKLTSTWKDALHILNGFKNWFLAMSAMSAASLSKFQFLNLFQYKFLSRIEKIFLVPSLPLFHKRIWSAMTFSCAKVRDCVT